MRMPPSSIATFASAFALAAAIATRTARTCRVLCSLVLVEPAAEAVVNALHGLVGPLEEKRLPVLRVDQQHVHGGDRHVRHDHEVLFVREECGVAQLAAAVAIAAGASEVAGAGVRARSQQDKEARHEQQHPDEGPLIHVPLEVVVVVVVGAASTAGKEEEANRCCAGGGGGWKRSSPAAEAGRHGEEQQ
jgi:hypothetical protein